MTSDALAATPLCSFNTNRRAAGFKGRKRTAMSHQCGNSMAVSSVGAVLLWILAYTVDNESESTLNQFILARVMTPARSLSLTSSLLTQQPSNSQSQFGDDAEDTFQTGSDSQVSVESSLSLFRTPSKFMLRTRDLSLSIESRKRRRASI